MRYESTTETITVEQGHQYHITTIPCPECRDKTVLTVKGTDLYSYHQGTYMQDAFPYLTNDDRERLISGVCAPCFKKLFEGDDYE